MATNTGLALLGFSGSGPPAVLALPHQVLTLDAIASMPEAAPNAPSAVRAAQGFTCLAAAGQALWTSSLRLETTAGPPGSSEKSVRLDQGPREAIAKLEHSGPVLLACSASGRSVSVVWPQRQLYCVFCLAPSGVWEVIDSGQRENVLWPQRGGGEESAGTAWRTDHVHSVAHEAMFSNSGSPAMPCIWAITAITTSATNGRNMT